MLFENSTNNNRDSEQYIVSKILLLYCSMTDRYHRAKNVDAQTQTDNSQTGTARRALFCVCLLAATLAVCFIPTFAGDRLLLRMDHSKHHEARIPPQYDVTFKVPCAKSADSEFGRCELLLQAAECPSAVLGEPLEDPSLISTLVQEGIDVLSWVLEDSSLPEELRLETAAASFAQLSDATQNAFAGDDIEGRFIAAEQQEVAHQQQTARCVSASVLSSDTALLCIPTNHPLVPQGNPDHKADDETGASQLLRLLRLLKKSTNINVKGSVLNELLGLVANSAYTEAVVTAGGIPVLAQLLGTTSNKTIQTTAGMILRTVAIDKHHRQLVIQAVAVPDLVLAVKRGTATAQSAALALLLMLCDSGGDSDKCKSVVAAGLIPPLLLLVQRRAVVSQIHATKLLSRLALHRTIRAVIAARGGVHILANTLAANDPDARVIAEVLRALRNLAKHTDAAALIAESVLPLLMRLLRDGQNVVKLQALLVIEVLARYPQHTLAVVAAGALAALRKVRKDWQSDLGKGARRLLKRLAT